MKNFVLILLLSVILASCGGNKDQYTLKGSIVGVDTGMIILQKMEDGIWIKLDSSRLEKGNFRFKGKIGLPEM